ncbi:MAG: HAD-IC family P-type ATPase [Candidatus Yanofskybacteria bacterium]|nr:HAD-IC family P-type ATPase [Candidatus Yanofskybacteria bacterium]
MANGNCLGLGEQYLIAVIEGIAHQAHISMETTNKITREIIKGSFWSLDIREVLDWLKTGKDGLNEKEAVERAKIFGLNVIKEHRRLPRLKIILQQFSSPLILILVIAGIITTFFGEWVETGVIFAAVVINAALGFWQENKAETVLELLKGYVRMRARASMPPATALSDRKPMVFSGTLAMQGFADAVVTGTGSDTEFGRIAALIAGKGRTLTPLQHSVKRFAVYSGAVLILFTLLLFGLGIYLGKGLHEMFLVAVAVAVSAVPESLPVALTVIMAIGVQRLARRKGVVRRLIAAETLGSTSIILTDKTGTLTQAKMELASALPHKNNTEENRFNLLRNAMLNTDVVIENPRDGYGRWIMSGRPLEVSLVRGAARMGFVLPGIRRTINVLDRLPFSSEHKFSVTVFNDGADTYLSILGAPEIVAGFTTLAREERERLITDIEKMALTGERVIGVASQKITIPHEDIMDRKTFSGLDFDGLITFRDPLRPQVSQAIHDIAAAGVRTVIVTGDHGGTAEAVARELGMIDGKGAVLTGEDMRHLSEEELEARADKISVYARVTPEQKVMLTRIYQKKGNIVAVSGDGVNDAPALHVADIGVAVGSGTDVAKSAADLVILDDNFETIVTAIKEGRRVLQNIRKVIVYLFSNVFDELFLIGGALAVGVALPINALQILFVNMFSDSFPAISFAFEHGVDGLKNRPDKLQKNLLDHEMKFFILIIGGVSSALLLLLYFILLRAGFAAELVRTFIFASFASYTLFLTFSLRSFEKSIIRYNPFSNRRLTASVGFGLLLVGAAVYFPWFQNILDTVSLPPVWLVAVFGVGILNIILIELGKKFLRRKN